MDINDCPRVGNYEHLSEAGYMAFGIKPPFPRRNIWPEFINGQRCNDTWDCGCDDCPVNRVHKTELLAADCRDGHPYS